jgi:hypothetical protein
MGDGGLPAWDVVLVKESEIFFIWQVSDGNVRSSIFCARLCPKTRPSILRHIDCFAAFWWKFVDRPSGGQGYYSKCLIHLLRNSGKEFDCCLLSIEICYSNSLNDTTSDDIKDRITVLAGECRDKFMVGIFAFHGGEACCTPPPNPMHCLKPMVRAALSGKIDHRQTSTMFL